MKDCFCGYFWLCVVSYTQDIIHYRPPLYAFTLRGPVFPFSSVLSEPDSYITKMYVAWQTERFSRVVLELLDGDAC